MKKFILNLVLMFSMTMSVNAQTAIETPKFLDNWYFGVNAGATTNLDFNSVFPLNANAGFVLGKEFTPVFGAQVEYVTWLGDKHMANSHTAFKAGNLGVNGTVNLSNLFFGYKGAPRKFEVSTVTGIGWHHVYGDHSLDGTYGREDNDELTAKTAVNLGWNLGSNRAHQIYVQPLVYWNLTNGPRDYVHFNKHYAQIGLSLGYIYHFKTSNGTHAFKTYDIGTMNDEINRLRAEVANKTTEVREVVKEVIVPKVVKGNEYVVYFSQNSDVLTDEAKAVLDNVSGSVVIDGFASPEGTEQYNKELSQRRANVVADYLRSKGVMVGDVVGHGVVGETSNRVAVVTVK
jgi:hypothetical protein